MLPFARMFEYGNTVLGNWYTGNELIAFDSINYASSGFTDYVGNKMLVGTYQSGGQVPSIAGKPIFSGNGLKIPYSCYVSTLMDVSTWLNSSWTLDYWIAQSTYTAQMQLSASPIAVYPSTAYNEYTNRFIIAEDGNVLKQWNNSTQGTSWGQSYSDLLSTDYVHFCITYNSSEFRVYTNGVLRQVISKSQFSLPTPANSQVVGLFGQGGYMPSKFSYVDRYRLRKGVIWNANFDTSTIYS